MEDKPSPLSPFHNDPETTCPSCGAFVGTYFYCPRCGASVEKRMSIKAVKIAAVLLSTFGLVFVYLWAYATKIPPIQVKDITPTMNFAYVKIKGKVATPPRIRYEEGTKKPQSLSFLVDDGSGTIQVAIYRAVLKQILKKDLLPRLEDEVEVAGPLAVQKGRIPRIYLQTIRHFRLIRRPIPLVPLGELHRIKRKVVRVEGLVAKVFPPRFSRYPVKILLWDSTGKAYLTLWPSLYQEVVQKLGELQGKAIRATVTLGKYKGRLQLHLSSALDIEISSKEKGKFLFVDQIAPEHMGKLVFLLGEVEEVHYRRKTLILKGEKQFLRVLYVFPGGRLPKVQRGEKLALRGVLERQKGEYLLFVVSPKDILFLSPRRKIGKHWVKKTSLSFQSLEEALKAREESLGKVRGEVVQVFPPKGKWPGKIWLQKGKAKLPLLVWKKDWQTLGLSRLKVGDQLEVEVKLKQYGGKKKLYLTREKKAVIFPRQEVKTLDLHKVSQVPLESIWKIEGQVTRIEPPKGKKAPFRIYLESQGEEVLLVLWPKQFEKWTGLSEGKRISFLGKVKQYNKERQIQYLGEGKILPLVQRVNHLREIPVPLLSVKELEKGTPGYGKFTLEKIQKGKERWKLVLKNQNHSIIVSVPEGFFHKLPQGTEIVIPLQKEGEEFKLGNGTIYLLSH